MPAVRAVLDGVNSAVDRRVAMMAYASVKTLRPSSERAARRCAGPVPSFWLSSAKVNAQKWPRPYVSKTRQGPRERGVGGIETGDGELGRAEQHPRREDANQDDANQAHGRTGQRFGHQSNHDGSEECEEIPGVRGQARGVGIRAIAIATAGGPTTGTQTPGGDYVAATTAGDPVCEG